MRQRKYHLVGTNSYSQQSVVIQGEKLVMKIESPAHYISVSPGDIVGIFFQGEGMELQCRSSRVARTYQANLNRPLVEQFGLNLAQDPEFRKAIKGFPLVEVHTFGKAIPN